MKQLLLTVSLFLIGLNLSAQQNEEKFGPIEVVQCHTFKITPKLSDLVPTTSEFDESEMIYTVPNKLRRYMHVNPPNLPGGVDPVLQKQGASHWARTPLQNWDGTDFTAFPPDPSGAAGPNHYVHMVNSKFTIYDKTGNEVQPAMNLGTLLGGGNDGDPIVMYDSDADRWFLSQFRQSNNSLQIAISQTPDPTGAYYSYEFSLNSFPDYPKYSIWSNAYFVSANKSAPQLYAMDRDKMLAGDPTATIQGFNVPSLTTNGFFSIIPSHATSALPSTSTPGYVFYFQDDGWGVPSDHIKIWEVDLDWVNSANSTISTPEQLAVSPFDSEFTTAWDDIEQPGTTEKLDGIPTAFMYMAQYREFSGYASIVLNHTVDIDGTNHAGIRWYELRKVGTNPWTIHQEGTFAPDAESRWLGSICMDYQGNIGLAYSVSGPTVYPSIRYTGRYAADPLGQMTIAEQDIIVGDGIQTGANRWGDYAQMTIDPVDDATFWYTGEYVATGNNRKSRIASFKLASDEDDDIGVVSIDDPSNGALSSAEAVTVTIYNFGLNDQSNFPVSYTIDGGTPVTETYAGTILSGTSAQYTFAGPANLGTPGNYEIKAYSGLSADTYNPNDTTVKTVQHLFPDNVGVIALTSPDGSGTYTASETVTITIENFGTTTQTSIPVAYELNGGTAVTETYTGSIPQGGTDTYSFSVPVDMSNLGTYDFVVYTDLAGDSDLSNDTLTMSREHEICQPSANCDFGTGFELFSLGSINNVSSGCSPNAYGDFTNLITNLEQGVTYDLQVQTGFASPVATVWIDFNDNFAFETNERLITDEAFGTSATTLSLAIPSTAQLGQHLLRARCAVDWSGSTVTDPCVDVSYGETEDYMVEVISFTGVDENSDLNFEVIETSPNLFNISIKGLSEDAQIEVHNSVGQLVLADNFSATGKALDLSAEADGYYLIRVYNNNFSKIKKVIVK